MVALNKKCVGVERSTSPEGGSIQVGKSTGTLQRHLNNHQIQLIAAGGSIGTALFISISRGLAKGGPDDALGFLTGWNFFFYKAFLIPFKITALSMVLSFWNDQVTNPSLTSGICAAVTICYA
ncbi:hypothetical protein CNMCM6457_010036 [Aspergillus fumigatiaffinis]|nr:hypothetical protein CNMCM6457_010036 [Aspergillus fumigatiaffinis]